MGLGAISIWKLVIVLSIILMLFGTSRLRNLGADLGGALKGFKTAVADNRDGKRADNGKEDSPPAGQA